MRIGIITDSIREQSTGIGFYTKELITELLTIDKDNEYYFVDYLRTSFNQERLIPINNPFIFFKTYLWNNYLPYSSRNINLDYIFSVSGSPHILPFKTKEIFFVHDISWYLYPKHHPISRVLFYKLTYKKCLESCCKIVAVSENTKLDLIKHFNVPDNKIYVIYPTFKKNIKDVSKIKYELKFPYILFVGTLEPRKNITSIIEAYKKIKKENSYKHKLVICGKKGWLYTNLIKQIQSSELKDDIIYLGYITDEEKKYLYKHADFFVYPSYYEGFGIPVLEAMNYGCAVITSNISSLPEVAGKGAVLIDPYDTDELASAMKKLIINTKLKNSLKNKANLQLSNLSNGKQISNFLKTLNAI